MSRNSKFIRSRMYPRHPGRSQTTRDRTELSSLVFQSISRVVYRHSSVAYPHCCYDTSISLAPNAGFGRNSRFALGFALYSVPAASLKNKNRSVVYSPLLQMRWTCDVGKWRIRSSSVSNESRVCYGLFARLPDGFMILS